MESHFACAVIYRERLPNDRRDREVEFLVIDYNQTQVKFPGGTNREYPDESVVTTMNREIFEETGLRIERSREIWRREVNGGHTQYGFLVDMDHCRGYLRTEPLTDHTDLLSPPRWVSAATLGRVFHTHQELYLAACRELRIVPTEDPNHPPDR